MGRQAEQPQGVEASLPVVDDGRLDIQERGHPARAEAYLQQLDDPPAGLLLGRIFPIGTEPDEEVLRTQGLGQTLRAGGGLQRERRRLVQMEGRERRLLGFLAPVLQDVGREVMPLEHPTDPSVIHRDVIRLPDNPGELAIGKGMGDRQLHDMLRDVTRQVLFERELTPRMRQRALINQSEEAITLKATQLAPQPPIIEARLAALLGKRPLPLQDGADLFIVS